MLYLNLLQIYTIQLNGTLLAYLKENAVQYSNIEIKSQIRFSLITFTCGDCSICTTSTYSNLLSKTFKTLCATCSTKRSTQNRIDTWEDVYKQLKEFHPQYEYIKPVVFVSKKLTKIVAVCSLHGEYLKSFNKHCIQICPGCTLDNLKRDGKLPGGYCEQTFAINPQLKDKLATLYYIKVGNMFKIGITINLKRRLSSLKNLFKKDIQVVKTWELSLYDAFLKEQEILSEFKEHRLFTKKSTELFSYDVLNLF